MGEKLNCTWRKRIGRWPLLIGRFREAEGGSRTLVRNASLPFLAEANQVPPARPSLPPSMWRCSSHHARGRVGRLWYSSRLRRRRNGYFGWAFHMNPAIHIVIPEFSNSYTTKLAFKLQLLDRLSVNIFAADSTFFLFFFSFFLTVFCPRVVFI